MKQQFGKLKKQLTEAEKQAVDDTERGEMRNFVFHISKSPLVSKSIMAQVKASSLDMLRKNLKEELGRHFAISDLNADDIDIFERKLLENNYLTHITRFEDLSLRGRIILFAKNSEESIKAKAEQETKEAE